MKEVSIIYCVFPNNYTVNFAKYFVKYAHRIGFLIN